MQRNEIVITRSGIVLRAMNGREFVIGKQYFNQIREAITISKRLFKSDKHKIMQINLDSWNKQEQ